MNRLEGITLTGQTSVQIGSDGFARFTNLGISGTSSGIDLSLEFYLEGAEVCVSIILLFPTETNSIEIKYYSQGYLKRLLLIDKYCRFLIVSRE